MYKHVSTKPAMAAETNTKTAIPTTQVQRASHALSSLRILSPTENCMHIITAEIIALTSAIVKIRSTAWIPETTSPAAASTNKVYTLAEKGDRDVVGICLRAPGIAFRFEMITSLNSIAAVFDKQSPPTRAAPVKPIQNRAFPGIPMYGSNASAISFTERSGSSVSPFRVHRAPATNAVALVTTTTVKRVPTTTSIWREPSCRVVYLEDATVLC
mmetsp:Transcript_11776/g.17544  ORF Transcript_11776/g.17544 Transcript_11776/m.17544 type:complete len:214 (+) Transcript_11776:58-699(+)